MGRLGTTWAGVPKVRNQSALACELGRITICSIMPMLSRRPKIAAIVTGFFPRSHACSYGP